MFYEFSKSLFDNLILEGFHILSGEAIKKVYNDKTELIALEKFSSSTIYLTFIHNTINYEIDELMEELVKINKYLWSSPYIQKYKQVIIVNILPTNKEDTTLIDNFLKSPSNIPDSLVYNVFWQVDLINNEIIVGKNQPSKVIGIEKLVVKSMEDYKELSNTNSEGERTIAENYKETVLSHIKKSKISIEPPYITYGLILFMFFTVVYTELINPNIILDLNVNANDVINHSQYYRLISSIFIHGGIMHFISNALGLYIFGTRIERTYGKMNMFLTFIIGGFIGNVFSIMLLPNVYSLGSSGGIYALMGFAICITFFKRNALSGLDFNTLAIMFIFMIFSTITIPNINHVAHIVGFVVGVIIAFGYVVSEKKQPWLRLNSLILGLVIRKMEGKMKAIIQRVAHSSVTVESKIVGEINQGFLVLLGVTDSDTKKDVEVLVNKISKLRIFEDENGKNNISIQDVDGELLVVSQFTLYADCRKGNRPSFINAGNPDHANELYEYFKSYSKDLFKKVESGVFGAHMNVEILNDGPFTIALECKDGNII